MFGREKITKGEAIAFAEKATAALQVRLQLIEAELKRVNEIIENRAALAAIETEGRIINLTFLRKGELHQISFHSNWSHDVEEWRKTLLG